MDSRVAHLVSVVETYRKENSDLATKLSQISQQVDLQTSFRAKERGHDEQQGRLTNVLLSRVSKLERRLEETQKLRETAEQALTESCDSYEQQLLNMTQSAQSASAEQRMLKASLAAREREAQEHIETIKELTEALSAMVNRVQKAYVPVSEYSSLAEQHDRATADLSRITSELTKLKEEHVDLERAHEELQQDATSLYETVRSDLVPRDEFEELTKKLQMLQDKLRDDTVSLTAFTDVVERYDELEANSVPRAELEALRGKLQQCELQCTRQQEDLEEANEYRLATEERACEAEERLDRCRAELKGLLSQIDELENTHSLVLAERDHYRDVYERGCEQIVALQKEKAALLIQLGNSKAVISRAAQRGYSCPDNNSLPPSALASCSGSHVGLNSSAHSMYSNCATLPIASSGLSLKEPVHTIADGVFDLNSTKQFDNRNISASSNASSKEPPDDQLTRLQRESNAWRRRYERSKKRSSDWQSVAQGLVSQRVHAAISGHAPSSSNVDNNILRNVAHHKGDSGPFSALELIGEDRVDSPASQAS